MIANARFHFVVRQMRAGRALTDAALMALSLDPAAVRAAVAR